jgi:hypothetical protein
LVCFLPVLCTLSKTESRKTVVPEKAVLSYGEDLEDPLSTESEQVKAAVSNLKIFVMPTQLAST